MFSVKKILSAIITMAMVLSCSSFAAPVTVATVETAVESGETLSSEEGVMEVFGEEVATEHARYGYLAYNLDFDVASGKTSGNLSDFTTNTAVSDKLSGILPASTKISALGTTGKTTVGTDGNGAYAIDGQYPTLSFRGYDANGVATSFPEGVYTLEWAAKTDGTCSTVRNVVTVYNDSDSIAGAAGETAYLTDKFVDYTTSFMYRDGKVISYNEKVLSPMKNGLKHFALYTPDKNATFKGARYYDYIKVWYKEATVNVTFDLDGKTVADFDTTVSAPYGSYKLSDVKLPDVGNARFVGWSTEKGGKIVATDTVELSADTTFYAIWDDYFYAPENEAEGYELVFDAHFNNVTVGKPHDGVITNYGSYGEADIADVVKGTENPQILLGCDSDDMMKSTWSNASNKTVAADDELFIVSGLTANVEKIWPRVCVAVSDGAYFADGYYTFAMEVAVEENANVENVTYFGYVQGTENGTNATRTLSATDLADDGTKQYITTSFVVNNGSMYYADTLNRSGNALDANSVTKFGFCFTVNRKAGTTAGTNVRIFADNFRMYYKPLHQPASYSENSIRVNTPAGIRFKSSITKLTREKESLVEYGYIVTRKTLLENAGVDMADFTMDNDKVLYVKGINYGTENGKKVDRVFENDGVNIFFTAAVYNIPADSYKEVIVVRPFVKLGEEVTYGDPMAASIYEVAQRLVSTENYETYKSTIDKILNGEEI